MIKFRPSRLTQEPYNSRKEQNDVLVSPLSPTGQRRGRRQLQAIGWSYYLDGDASIPRSG
jgi:hypothetical protein